MDLSTYGGDEALRRSEAQFRLLVEAVEEYAIFILGPQGRVATWNTGAEKIKGYTRDEILGRPLATFYTTEDREAGVPERTLAAARQSGKWTGEGWRVRKDGTRFWASATLTAVRNDDGHLVGFAKVTRDLTERHERDEALRQSEERYRRLFEEAQEGIGISTPDGTVIDVNPAAERILGYTRAELLKRPVTDFYVDPVASDEAFRKVAEGALREHEARVRRKDGTEIILQLSVTPIRGPGGEVQVMQGLFRDVTERREAEARLRDSEARFRALAENAPLGIGWSQDGLIRYVNPAYTHIVGYTRDELIGHPVEMIFHPEDWPVAKEQMRRRLEGEVDVVRYRARLRTKQGKTRHAEVNAAHIMYRGKQTLLGTLRDITEWREAQEALGQSEARYRHLFEAAQEGIIITTPEGGIVDINPAGLEILGYDQGELLRMKAEELYADPSERRRLLKEGIQVDAVRDVELHFRRKDGREIICQLSVSVRRGPGGEVEAFETFFRDVTEQKEDRKALHESEERFRTLVEESLIGIYLVQDGVFEYVNPAYAAMYGCARHEMIGADPFLFLHPSEHARARAKSRLRLSGTSDTGRGIYRARRCSGETFLVDANGAVVTYRGRAAIIGMAQDVTERRRLQRDVLKMQEEERRRIGRDLHDGVASDLTGVSLITTELTRKARQGQRVAPEELEEILAIIKHSAQEIRTLSHGLSPVGLEEGLAPALTALVERTRGEFVCTFETVGRLPSLTPQHAMHLYRVAQEAVANAVHHAGAHRIRVCLEADGPALVLTVEDDGKGFDIQRVEAKSLGLRTMRYRAELLGAEYTIDSHPGTGTRMRCRLVV